MPTRPDPLDRLLDHWTETPAPPPRLAAEVWRRLDQAGGRPPAPGWLAAVESWFARPSFALLFVACCALTGLYWAEVRVNRLEQERSAQLARSYLQLIDPLLAAPGEPRS